jgi:hypothetical protein
MISLRQAIEEDILHCPSQKNLYSIQYWKTSSLHHRFLFRQFDDNLIQVIREDDINSFSSSIPNVLFVDHLFPSFIRISIFHCFSPMFLLWQSEEIFCLFCDASPETLETLEFQSILIVFLVFFFFFFFFKN